MWCELRDSNQLRIIFEMLGVSQFRQKTAEYEALLSERYGVQVWRKTLVRQGLRDTTHIRMKG